VLAAVRVLDLPADQFAVFGSGPLLAHGLRAEVSDVDLLAAPALWSLLSWSGPVLLTDSGIGEKVTLPGNVEVYSAWAPGE
jgi:hypothetical protein